MVPRHRQFNWRAFRARAPVSTLKGELSRRRDDDGILSGTRFWLLDCPQYCPYLRAIPRSTAFYSLLVSDWLQKQVASCGEQ